jgi:hypothetical protein
MLDHHRPPSMPLRSPAEAVAHANAGNLGGDADLARIAGTSLGVIVADGPKSRAVLGFQRPARSEMSIQPAPSAHTPARLVFVPAGLLNARIDAA